MEVFPFLPEHILNYSGEFLEQASCVEMAKEREYLERLAAAGPAWSAFHHQRYCGSIGIGLIWDGVGEVWGLLTDAIHLCPVAFHRNVSRKLPETMGRYRLHRIQTAVLASDGRAIKWIQHLGFACEGLMRCYGPNKEDYLRWAKWVL